jgi:DNA-binding NtrC family response regulator
MWDKVNQPGPDVSPKVIETIGNATGSRILMIDDDPHYLRILQRILAEEKFQATTCSNPCEALESLRSDNFDLIICDLRMPDCDGLNLLQAIRNGGNDIPVIILTAYGEVESYLEAMNAGATEYLNKPMKSEELLAVVRRCLNRSNIRHADRPAPTV